MANGLKYSISSPRNGLGPVPIADNLKLGGDLGPSLATPCTSEMKTPYNISNRHGGRSPTPRPRGERRRMRGTPRWFNSQKRSRTIIKRVETPKQHRPRVGYEDSLTQLPILRGPNRHLEDYNGYFALLIVFESDDLGGCLIEAEKLKDQLEERWGFKTNIYKIPFLDPPEMLQENVENAICNFTNANDGDNNLLLVHYGGHGSFGSRKEYTLTMGHKARCYEVRFQPIREHLLNCKSDVAIFLDSCYAAAGISRSHDPHTVEVLAACDSTAVTPAVGWRSFTSGVLRVLRNHSQEALALEDLCEELRKSSGPPFRKAVYHALEKSRWGSITLRRSAKSYLPKTL